MDRAAAVELLSPGYVSGTSSMNIEIKLNRAQNRKLQTACGDREPPGGAGASA